MDEVEKMLKVEQVEEHFDGAMQEAQTYLDKVLRQKEMKVDGKGGKD